jgi:hypothetical protein
LSITARSRAEISPYSYKRRKSTPQKVQTKKKRGMDARKAQTTDTHHHQLLFSTLKEPRKINVLSSSMHLLVSSIIRFPVTRI